MNKKILGITLLLFSQVHTAGHESHPHVTLPMPVPGASVHPGSTPIQRAYASYPPHPYGTTQHHGTPYGAPLSSPYDAASADCQPRTSSYPSVPAQVGFTPPGSFDGAPTHLVHSSHSHRAYPGAYASAPPQATDHDAKEREAFERFKALHLTSQRPSSPTGSIATTHSVPPQYGLDQYSGLPFVSDAYILVAGLKARVHKLEMHLTDEARVLAAVKKKQTCTDQSPQPKRRGSVLRRLGKSEERTKMDALEKEQQRKDKELRDAALPIQRCIAVASICKGALERCMKQGTDALLAEAGMASEA